MAPNSVLEVQGPKTKFLRIVILQGEQVVPLHMFLYVKKLYIIVHPVNDPKVCKGLESQNEIIYFKCSKQYSLMIYHIQQKYV